MRYAIISDIHANAVALRAVLADATDMHVDKIICLGDVLGYGPDAVETLELVYRRVHVCLAGNHDDVIAGRYPVDDFTDFAADAVKRQHAELSAEAIDWLAHLPYSCEFPLTEDMSGPSFACAHGDYSSPEDFNYILEPEDAMPSWQSCSHQLIFVGHTHKPGICVIGESGLPHMLEPANFALEPGKRYIVNVGSVGYPRVGALRSFYCIYDDRSQDVFFRSIPFDIDTYTEKMHGQGLAEAPWLRTQAKARQGIDVRAEAHFARTGGKKKLFLSPKAATPPKPEPPHVMVAVRPQTVRPLSVEPEQARTNVSAGRPAALDPQPKAGKRGPNRAPFFIVGGILLLFMLAFAAVKSRDNSSAELAAQSAALPPPLPLENESEPTTLPMPKGKQVICQTFAIPANASRIAFEVMLRGAPCQLSMQFKDANKQPVDKMHWSPIVKHQRKWSRNGFVVPATAKFATFTATRVEGEAPCQVLVDMKVIP